MKFTMGDLGWAHDAFYSYNFQYSDYGNYDFLIDKGFQNFINTL